MPNDENNLNNDFQKSEDSCSNSESALNNLEDLVKIIRTNNRKRLSDHELITLSSAAYSVDLKKGHPLYPLINPLKDIVPLIGMGIKSSEVRKQVKALIKSGAEDKNYKVPIDMDVSMLQLRRKILIDNLRKEISNDEPRGEITSNMITHYMLIGEILFQMGKHISFKDTDKIPKELLVWIDTLIVWRHLFSHPERAPQLDLSNVDREYVAYKLVENAKEDVGRDPYEILTHVHYPRYVKSLIDILTDIDLKEMVLQKDDRPKMIVEDQNGLRMRVREKWQQKKQREREDQEKWQQWKKEGRESRQEVQQRREQRRQRQKLGKQNLNKERELKQGGTPPGKEKYKVADIPMRMIAYLKNKADEYFVETPIKASKILEKIYFSAAYVFKKAEPKELFEQKLRKDVDFVNDLTSFLNGPKDEALWLQLCKDIKERGSKLSPEILQFYKERPGKKINNQDHIFDTFLLEFRSAQQAHIDGTDDKTVVGVLQVAHKEVNLLTRILEKWAVNFQNRPKKPINKKITLVRFLREELKSGFLFFDACEKEAKRLKEEELTSEEQTDELKKFFKDLESGYVFSEGMLAELLKLRQNYEQTVEQEFYDGYLKALKATINSGYKFNKFIEAARGKTLPLLLDKWSNMFNWGMNEYSFEMPKLWLPHDNDDEYKFSMWFQTQTIDMREIDYLENSKHDRYIGKKAESQQGSTDVELKPTELKHAFTWINRVQKLMKDMSDPKDVTAIKDEQICVEKAQKKHMLEKMFSSNIQHSGNIKNPVKLNSRKRELKKIRGINWMTSGWEARYQLTAYLINCKNFASPRLKDEYFDVFSVLRALRGLRAHAATPYTPLVISNLVKRQNIDQLEAYYISSAKLFVRDLMRENFYKIINYVYQTTPWHFFKGNPEKMKRFDIDKTLVEQLIPYNPKAKAKVKNKAQDIITKVSSGLASLILPDTPSLNDLGKEEAERVRKSVKKIITPALKNSGITLFSSRAQAKSTVKIFPIKDENSVIKNDVDKSKQQTIKRSVKKRTTPVNKKQAITLLSPIPVIKKVEQPDPSSVKLSR